MTLVERFIEIDGWSTSSKTALLSGLLLSFHVPCTLITGYGVSQLTWFNLSLFNTVFWLWIAAIALCFVLSVMTALLGQEGRWTRWVLLIPYGVFMSATIYGAGGTSTALFAWCPMGVLLIALWYGPRFGWISLLYMFCLLLIVLVVPSSGIVPFAPVFLERSIDTQKNGIYVGAVSFGMMVASTFCFSLVALLVSARQLERAKLDRSARLIARYLPSQLAERHGATINQFVGDGIMIFFGAPQFTSDQDHALRAVRMALEMQRRLSELEDVWVQRGIRKPFRARIGINTGHVSVGDYGSQGRKVYSAIGVQTNIAARIQSHCEPGRVLISDTTWALVKDEVGCTDIGELQMKGVHYPVRVYEVAETAAAPSLP